MASFPPEGFQVKVAPLGSFRPLSVHVRLALEPRSRSSRAGRCSDRWGWQLDGDGHGLSKEETAADQHSYVHWPSPSLQLQPGCSSQVPSLLPAGCSSRQPHI